MNPAVYNVAAALRVGRDEIVTRWLDRIASRVTVERQFIFPSETLIDDVPFLIDGIAGHLQSGEYDIAANSPAICKARELGALRFKQGFSARQILWEYELLSAIVLQYLDESVLTAGELPEPFVRRFLRAISAIQRATVEEYLSLSDARIREREDRLRGFNRALSHELRSDVGSIVGATRMLQETFIAEDESQRDRFLGMIVDNIQRVERLIDNLLQLSRVDLDPRHHRHVLIPHAAAEAARQLRDYAEAHGVRIEIAGDLPPIEVNAAAVELTLINLVANGIKYHDSTRTDRYVSIRCAGIENSHVVIEVIDNGRGVTEEDRPSLFTRFFRSAATADVDGTGLGLSLVREVIERGGGRVWADFPESGETVFAFTLPARRTDDRTPGQA